MSPRFLRAAEGSAAGLVLLMGMSATITAAKESQERDGLRQKGPWDRLLFQWRGASSSALVAHTMFLTGVTYRKPQRRNRGVGIPQPKHDTDRYSSDSDRGEWR